MEALDMIARTRSVRRYKADMPVDRSTLEYIANGVRFVGSAGNRQRLRLLLVNDKPTCDMIFGEIKFAARLTDWEGPSESERPQAYIVVMTEDEESVNLGIDMGLAAEAMLLIARERGLGGCIFRSFNPVTLGEKLGRAPYKPCMVISLGYPDEIVVIQDANDHKKLDDPDYFRDIYGHHMVIKLPLDHVIID